MKERILEFLRAENKSSAQFAEEIGVQPSGISHILSGRNNPSLDFVLKMLERYKYLSVDWLLFGKGSMYKDGRVQTLFDEQYLNEITEPQTRDTEEKSKSSLIINDFAPGMKNKNPVSDQGNEKRVEKIVCFFNDRTFIEYNPG